MTKAFISYSRRDSAFTRKLADALTAHKYDLWVDFESIPPTVDWKQHIQKGVEESDVLVFLISPDSLKSRECSEEIAQAIKNGKRLITLLVRDVNSADLPKEISHINWISFEDADKFDHALEKLMQAINTDYEWVQVHSRLQIRALEWDRAAREKSFLLRGKDLEFYERQVVLNSAKEPSPTELQQEFVLRSRTAAAKQRTTTMAALIVVAISMLVLAVAAVFWAQKASDNERIAKTKEEEAIIARAEAQKNASIASANAEAALRNADEALKNALIAQIGEVSSLAVGKLNQDYNESLLYSVESYKRALKNGYNLERAKAALLTTLQNQPGLEQVLPAHGDWVNEIRYSKDGQVMASASWDVITYLWDVSDPLNPRKRSQFEGDDLAMNADQNLFATTAYDENYEPVIKLWDIQDISKPAQLAEFPGNYIVDFLQDGKTLIIQHEEEVDDSGEFQYFVELWNVSVPSRPTRLHQLEGTGAALSPDGSLLAVYRAAEEADGNNLVSLWNVSNPANPSMLATLTGDFEFYTGELELRQVATFGPGNDLLAIAGYDASGNAITELWDISNPTSPIKSVTIAANSDWVNCLALSPDGQWLAIGANNGNIALWDISDPVNPAWNPSSNTLTGHALAVNAMAFMSDGKILATGSFDGNIMLWEMSSIINPLQVHAPRGNTITFNAGGDRLISTYFDEVLEQGQTLVWDVSSSVNPVQLGQVNTLADTTAISADGNILITSHLEFGEVGSDGRAQLLGDTTLWDMSNPSQPVEHRLLEQYADTLVLSPNGTVLVATASEADGETQRTSLWDISDAANPIQFGTVDDVLDVTEFSSDGKLLALSGWTNESIEFWDVSAPGDFSKLGELTGSHITFSPDNKMAAIQIVDEDMTPSEVQLWDLSTWTGRKQIATLPDSSNPTFSRDGTLLATTVNDYQEDTYMILLWEVANPQEPTSDPLQAHSRDVTSLAFSPDGKILSSASYDKSVILWDVSDPAQPVRGSVLNGHTDWLFVLTFNEDGTILASGGDDHNVILWQVHKYNDAAQIGTLLGDIHNHIRKLQFVSNTRLISDNSTLWNIDPASWVEKACNLAGTNFTHDKWQQLFPDDPYEDTCPNIVPESFTSVEGTIIPVNPETALLPACTGGNGTQSGCPLLDYEPRSQFCVDKTSYTLYAVPEGSTLQALDANYKCNNEGVFGGDQLYSCYGPPTQSFRAQVCNTACAATQSDQCGTGLGLDPTGSCCMPITASDSNGCMEVTLEIKDCKAIP